MSRPQGPRVKLPETTPPKLNQPNPNSWATKQAKTLNKTPTATNRDKYENKPMPPTPEASPSPAEQPLTARKNHGYIQPAIPLNSPGPAGSSVKNRAATDPVMPKPLFASTTTTVNQLRKKYSQSKHKQKSKEDEENTTHQPPSPPLVITKKASQILGVYPVKDNNRGTPPVSAPPSTSTPDPFRTSTESARGQQVSPSRQVQSTPVPTRRYLQENNLQAFTGTRASQESKELPNEPSNEMKQPHLREGSDGFLNPTRLGIYGRKGEVEYVGQSEMQRVPSFVGVIEHPDSPREGGDTVGPDPARIDWIEHTLQPQYSGEILHPMIYSPNNYAGVWENDPNVVNLAMDQVPPPPLSFPGFQPSGPVPPGLVQMELNLHHHIETCFSSLMRLTTDNADRMIDKLVRRFEDLQEAVERGMKGVKGEMKDVKKEMVSIRKAFAERPDALKESISSLGEKLGHLDKKIDEIGNRYQYNTDASENEHEVSSAYSQEKVSPRRHSESAHTSASSRPEQRQAYPSNATRGSATTHSSVNSSKERRSNTTNSSGAGLRRSDERSARRELFAEFGAVNGRVPDIREHPAYRGVAEGYGQSSPIFQAPDFGQTWYQHAFGSDRHNER
ncbi:MAG: hypothetical protein LQ343_005385 [Gyalolechia ehrenbergii]|nr:MAG: hypothetical protein LQ343_005385 [Gyalolechia ehrenbergii]